ncbi:MAG: SDR family oxidoreductase [Planctomycetes bacterium]|nr:SDR family oxidoreductase [Planctomycetota bacterium]
MNRELENRIALITGGSAGIGLGAAKVMVREGARLAIVARDRARLDRAAALIAAIAERQPFAMAGDITNPKHVAEIAAEVERDLGRIDILVINFGGPKPGEVARRRMPEARSDDDALLRFAAGLPMKRLLKPEEIGEVIAFLASDRASDMTGCFVPVDGGAIRAIG